ncbi:MAG TPA: carboxypeptidase-like regulatory domain-containing protein, partial [Bacteroidia bacterium]|nr:carboxypeptidase-like regulatory domain-containing protein [Bacteroidia bacterium]
MKNLSVSFICLLLWPAMTVAKTEKTSLSGKVTDKITGEIIPFADVFLPDLKTGTRAKADGTYFIDNLPSIKTLVYVHMTGYTAITENIDLALITIMDFALEPAIIELATATVTGSSHATEARKNPVPITIIDQQYLSQNPTMNIVDALGKTPGVSGLSSGPNISKPVIRGLGYN